MGNRDAKQRLITLLSLFTIMFKQIVERGCWDSACIWKGKRKIIIHRMMLIWKEYILIPNDWVYHDMFIAILHILWSHPHPATDGLILYFNISPKAQRKAIMFWNFLKIIFITNSKYFCSHWEDWILPNVLQKIH